MHGSPSIFAIRKSFAELGGAAATWPLAARAQRPKSVVGFLGSVSADDRPHHTEAFRQGLDETGYAEGRNLTIEYRYADNRFQLRRLGRPDRSEVPSSRLSRATIRHWLPRGSHPRFRSSSPAASTPSRLGSLRASTGRKQT